MSEAVDFIMLEYQVRQNCFRYAIVTWHIVAYRAIPICARAHSVSALALNNTESSLASHASRMRLTGNEGVRHRACSGFWGTAVIGKIYPTLTAIPLQRYLVVSSRCRLRGLIKWCRRPTVVKARTPVTPAAAAKLNEYI